ncbi:unnamed protein product [Gongylonema pulchrum]|nr:unnamed protein product [Gongylonema pulchrum]
MLITHPILGLEELWHWEESTVPHVLVGDSLQNYCRRHDYPETLICHDMKGGYLAEDR